MSDNRYRTIIDNLHDRLSHGLCKGCKVYEAHEGPSIKRPECLNCAGQMLPKGVDE